MSNKLKAGMVFTKENKEASPCHYPNRQKTISMQEETGHVERNGDYSLYAAAGFEDSVFFFFFF